LESKENNQDNTYYPQESTSSVWGKLTKVAFCQHCDWNYILADEASQHLCPHCFMAHLTPLEDDIDQYYSSTPPEMLIPTRLDNNKLSISLQKFSKGIPYAPKDLGMHNLISRLTPVFIPMWLVDSQIQATWQAEVGFNYQVVSHQDRYHENLGGWKSQEVKENRVRWEIRLGNLSRLYHNIPAPALEEYAKIVASTGAFDTRDADSYKASALEGWLVKLPNRLPQDAWGDAKPVFHTKAAEECRQACNSDHIRQFTWNPTFDNQNWTLLLLPIYTSYYLDDENKPQVITINGQSGQIAGARRASMKRASRMALIIITVAVLIFLLSLLLSAASMLLPVLLAFGVLGLVVSLLVGAGAILPFTKVWWFNRNQKS